LKYDLGTLIEIYVGRGNLLPVLDDAPVIAIIDQCDADDVTTLLKKIVTELAAVAPDWTSSDLLQNAAYAADETLRRHPEMGQTGRDALQWLYSWWWK
jgi:hypothetical protein